MTGLQLFQNLVLPFTGATRIFLDTFFGREEMQAAVWKAESFYTIALPRI